VTPTLHAPQLLAHEATVKNKQTKVPRPLTTNTGDVEVTSAEHSREGNDDLLQRIKAMKPVTQQTKAGKGKNGESQMIEQSASSKSAGENPFRIERID
jgi:hypothetical protein